MLDELAYSHVPVEASGPRPELLKCTRPLREAPPDAALSCSRQTLRSIIRAVDSAAHAEGLTSPEGVELR